MKSDLLESLPEDFEAHAHQTDGSVEFYCRRHEIPEDARRAR